MHLSPELNSKLSKISILMIDDSYFARYIAKHSILELGLKSIYETDNGSEGVKLFKKHRPNIILIDIVMDEMNGLEILKLIKEEDKNAHIIMVSAVDVPYILSDCIDLGIEDFIVKPYSSSDLRNSIIDALQLEE